MKTESLPEVSLIHFAEMLRDVKLKREPKALPILGGYLIALNDLGIIEESERNQIQRVLLMAITLFEVESFTPENVKSLLESKTEEEAAQFCLEQNKIYEKPGKPLDDLLSGIICQMFKDGVKDELQKM